ncbi:MULTISPECIES: hydrogenase accessory protein [Rhizobium]|uniref:Hydrogenase expression/formation protein n=1 Tax=Rhizobium leguminosarum TaxID=384 RepID=A0A2K9ZHB1_RHILE|nr:MULTISPECIES: hydrogenase accessory protein [Rhizobium]AUW47632.1 Hydrogenase expression/formation protein HupG [Rhizobium leguminosarum]MBY5399792.1 hydrogenase accessory protein [Rhizobium leguminosarum]MBY5481747.1 hydrogenase accessory protein [Rhizobium leguminosarum]MBY5503311.1 hydrogenase accessory protein [Rhizobium leguminosarum]MBY5517228.1 hydrogenase accessory protein [Rhizobium leguminosarum]
MPSALVRALSERAHLPVVDETNIDAFLAPAAGEPDNAVLFFTGDPAQRPEADDVAVVLPELMQVFRGRLRGAVVRRATEDKLKARFNVVVMPSLVVTRRDQPVGVLGKIRDWSEYVEKISAWLSPDVPVMVSSGGPKVEITHAGKEIAR